MLASNEALRRGSTLLQEKSEALLEELSIKEAEWSQREDRLKEEVRDSLKRGVVSRSGSRLWHV